MKSNQFRKHWDDQPVMLIMAAAILFRLLAAVFAKGWGMFNDHYLVIESAQSWVNGPDYNNRLPWTPENTGPTGHNLFYPALNFLFFSFHSWVPNKQERFIIPIIPFLIMIGSMGWLEFLDSILAYSLNKGNAFAPRFVFSRVTKTSNSW